MAIDLDFIWVFIQNFKIQGYIHIDQMNKQGV